MVLYEALFSSIISSSAWRTPIAGNYNTPIVVWNFREASTINPIAADLLSI